MVVLFPEKEHRGEASLEGWDGGVRKTLSVGKLELKCLMSVQLGKFSRKLDIGAWGSEEIWLEIYICLGFPCGSAGKESACSYISHETESGKYVKWEEEPEEHKHLRNGQR